MRTLQKIENLFGGLACSTLSLFSFLLPKENGLEPTQVKRVLCVKFWGIGSLILASPFFQEARRTFPNAKVELLTLSSNRGVVKMLEGVDKVHYLDLGNNTIQAFQAFIRCLFYVRAMRVDALVDLEFYTRASAILTFFSNARIRVGYFSPGVWRGRFHTRRIAFNAYRHVTANFYNLLEPFGVETKSDALQPLVNIAPEGAQEVDRLLERVGVDTSFFAVNVNAGELAYERRWPPERFADLVSRLCSRYSKTALFVGSPSEKEYVASVATKVAPGKGRAVSVAGELTLNGLGELFKRCDFLLTNDSGPLHLAVAVGTPVAAFFGPETPELYGPVGSEHLVFFPETPCAPCISAERAKQLFCWQESVRCQNATSVDDALNGIVKRFGETL